MSLHKFAEQVASQGRGDDSLLVHMTPEEVRNLQQFAQANGTTLTINPTTGLPEAGMLSDLFKTIAPIALGAFLGPAGFGMSSMMAGLTTGGITALATGSLSRGLMAGLGAYGGAGLGESLMSAGTGAGMTEALAGSSTGNLGQAFGDVAATATDGSAGSAFNKFLTSNANPATMSASELASSGLKAAASDPLGFAKGNLGNLAYAAAPIMAGAMVPTTTKLPEPRDSGLIRQMAFNINPDTGKPDPLYGMREMTPVKASEFGNKTFQGQRDLFYQQNPNPYELGVGSLNQPPRMAGGGIVALAAGGALSREEQLYQQTGSWEAAAALRDQQDRAAQITADAQRLMAPAAAAQTQVAQTALPDVRSTGTGVATQTAANQAVTSTPTPTGSAGLQYALSHGQTADQYYNTIANQYNDLTGYGDTFANATDAQIDKAFIDAQKYGITRADLMTALEKSGGSTAQRYAIGAGDMGLSGLNQNINDYLARARLDPTFKAMTGLQQQEAARAAMGTVNMNDADVFRATGKTIAELFPSTLTKPISVIPTGYYGNNTGNAFTTTPGDITTNPDGSVTVHPNIPGRPDGGFTGMGQVRDTYTAGGGSLGYTAPVPKTAAEHNALYNRQTDDSLDAYNYLMGKGKNLTQRKAETKDRPVMARYDEAILGRKIPRLGSKTTTDKVTTVVGVPGNPQSYFDEKAYLAANPDVAEELRTGKSVSGQPTLFKSGYEHYLMYGKAGGRPFTGDYEGYTTAAALANSAGAGGGGDGNATSATTAANAVSDSNTANSISGLAAPADNSISVSDAVASPADSAASSDGSADGGPSGDGTGGEARGGLMPHGRYRLANGGMPSYAMGGGLGSLGSYSDGGRLLKGPGDGVSDSIPATIGRNRQPARLADGEFVIPARIVSELGNGSTDAGAKKLYAMMDRVQRARGKTTGKNKVAANSRSDKYLPA